jgi:tRNA (cytidine56-2'-O)-methyltransferase
MIHVLRLNHRVFRDQRISSHVFLAARALGADSGSYTGQKDSKMEKSVEKAVKNWGGNFRVEHIPHWKPITKEWKSKGKVAHLTMYGLPLEQEIKEIRKENNILVVIGGEKVPIEVYQMADWNVSVTSQPHSEVSSLAIFLYELFGGDPPQKFEGAKLKIVPKEKGKEVMEV